MKDSASLAPKMLHAEQVSTQVEPEKPWLRQRNEPAIWFMRFKRYLDLGPKRSLRKALLAEPDTQKATESTKKKQEQKKLSDVSVPGAWKRASKVWNWQERAAAHDLAEQAKDAIHLREFAGTQVFSSRAFRIIELNYMAKCLKMILESWKAVRNDQTKEYLALVARYQSVLRDIETSMQGFDIANDAIDAAAWHEMCKEVEKFNQKK